MCKAEVNVSTSTFLSNSTLMLTYIRIKEKLMLILLFIASVLLKFIADQRMQSRRKCEKNDILSM